MSNAELLSACCRPAGGSGSRLDTPVYFLCKSARTPENRLHALKLKRRETYIYLFLMKWHGPCVCLEAKATKRQGHEKLIFVGRREADEGGENGLGSVSFPD